MTQVPQKSLFILDNLKKLEVQENRIEVIKEGDFEGLKNLDSLILAHNHLKKIPANVFSHLKLLNSLELEGNSITYIDKDAFSGLEGKPKTPFYSVIAFIIFIQTSQHLNWGNMEKGTEAKSFSRFSFFSLFVLFLWKFVFNRIGLNGAIFVWAYLNLE